MLRKFIDRYPGMVIINDAGLDCDFVYSLKQLCLQLLFLVVKSAVEWAT